MYALHECVARPFVVRQTPTCSIEELGTDHASAVKSAWPSPSCRSDCRQIRRLLMRAFDMYPSSTRSLDMSTNCRMFDI